MTQREFDSRVKGAPRAARGNVATRRLREVALLLFGVAFAIMLFADRGLLSIRGTPILEGTAIQAFGPAPMHAARGVVRRSGTAPDSPIARGGDLDVEGFFARAWQGAVARMRVVFDAASTPDMRSSMENLIDQAARTERALAAAVDSLMPSFSDAPAMALNSNLPMLAGIGAFAALMALCFGAAIFVTGKSSRGARSRAVRYGARRF